MSVTPSPPAPMAGIATQGQPPVAGGVAEPPAVVGGATETSAVADAATEPPAVVGDVAGSPAVVGDVAGSSVVVGDERAAASSGSSPVVGDLAEPTAVAGGATEQSAGTGGERAAASSGLSVGSSGVSASFRDESGGSRPYVAGNGRYVNERPNPEDVPFTVVAATPGLPRRAAGNLSAAFPALVGNSGPIGSAWTPKSEGAANSEGTADETASAARGTAGTAQADAARGTAGTAQADAARGTSGTTQADAGRGTAGTAQADAARGTSGTTQANAGRGISGIAQSASAAHADSAERSGGSFIPGSSDGVVSFAPTTRMWAFLAIVTILGAVLGAVISHQFSPGFTAVTLVQGAPARLDPGALTQEDDRYVQTEAAYAGLADSEITEALTEQLGRTDVTAADVTVVPGTTILRFVGSGETNQLAADVANISAQTYVQTWRTRMSTALTESLAVIDAAAAESATGLLVDQRATLDTQLEAVQELQRIVQPASAQTAQATSNYAPGFILGALVGATLGLIALLWFRRHSFNHSGGGK